MPDRDRPLLGDVTRDFAQLRAELGEMLGLRWELARLELGAVVAAVKRLALLLAIAAVMLMTALPLAAVVAAEILDKVRPDSKIGWLIGFCLLLAVSASLVGWTAWRRFHGSFTGFEETLEELHEDLAWLRELTERHSSTDEKAQNE